MSGFGYDTTTVWLTIALGAGDPVIVTGRDDGVNGFTWSAKRGDTPLTVTFDREVLIDGITPEDESTSAPMCPDCGRPITLQPTGWWSHDGMPNGCWRLSEDGPGDPPEDEHDCDCSTDLVPGAAWPMASDGDDSLPWVECCGDCQVFESDDDAAEAIAKKIGGQVQWTTLAGHEDHHAGGGLHPFVLPTDYPLPAGHPASNYIGSTSWYPRKESE